MYGENFDLANDIAKDHIHDLIVEADAERLANEFVAARKANGNGINQPGIINWLMDVVRPTSRISTKRV